MYPFNYVNFKSSKFWLVLIALLLVLGIVIYFINQNTQKTKKLNVVKFTTNQGPKIMRGVKNTGELGVKDDKYVHYYKVKDNDIKKGGVIFKGITLPSGSNYSVTFDCGTVEQHSILDYVTVTKTNEPDKWDMRILFPSKNGSGSCTVTIYVDYTSNDNNEEWETSSLPTATV